MRYDKGHKEATRRRIVEVASRSFLRNGVAEVGVAALMEAAGLTRGGFYAHFVSKEALLQEAVANAFGRLRTEFQRVTAADERGIDAILSFYLRPRYRDKPERGCVAASLAAEIARHPAATKAVFTQEFERVIELIGEQLVAIDDELQRRSAAIAIFAMMAGTLQLARAVSDATLSDQILESGIAAALLLSGRRDG